MLRWLSSVCWVRTLDTPKWDILAIDVAVYCDSKLRKLTLQTYQNISPAKLREKPPKPATRNEWKGTPPEAKAHKMKGHGKWSLRLRKRLLVTHMLKLARCRWDCLKDHEEDKSNYTWWPWRMWCLKTKTHNLHEQLCDPCPHDNNINLQPNGPCSHGT